MFEICYDLQSEANQAERKNERKNERLNEMLLQSSHRIE